VAKSDPLRVITELFESGGQSLSLQETDDSIRSTEFALQWMLKQVSAERQRRGLKSVLDDLNEA
jgi:hypothetical protein